MVNTEKNKGSLLNYKGSLTHYIRKLELVLDAGHYDLPVYYISFSSVAETRLEL